MAVPKKKIVKMSMQKKEGKPLIVAFGARAFFVNNGPILPSLKELAAALRTMADAQYRHHAAGQRNDFAKWVEEVLLDSACAKDLRGAKDRIGALKAAEKHLGKYRQ
ncbi:MAG: hypothetical protein G01um101472_410 [Parcubacteria group bacterium Gr01-1014_72]|nr:MAG: hypothetical protein G01um101472_410 [Parcubacteria group bacterium Gr01-1014_72]